MSIQAIETVYNGYRFRSRLEARWAVFFDTLGIKYEYEYDGFPLHGKWYLPDFWLPKLDIWIEIKGQRPTKDEIQQAKLLAWYTQKPVYIFFGSVWYSTTYKDTNFSSAQLYGFLVFCFDSGHKEDEIVSYTELAKRFTARDICTKTIAEVNENLQKFMDRNQIGAVNDLLDCQWWAECPNCHMIGICMYGIPEYGLPCNCYNTRLQVQLEAIRVQLTKQPNDAALDRLQVQMNKIKASMFDDKKISYSKTPRLIAAYTAARQARFEFGENGRKST